MKEQKQAQYDGFNETDRMINEGLGNGSINPKYAEVHAELKAKEELLSLSIEQDKSKKKDDDK